MVGRDPSEGYRASTALELFFDLVFVVAVSLAADRLHLALADGRVTSSLVSYGLVFFGIWWAWVNFTWFASAYDTDDVVYRIFVFVTITGALVLAAGVPRAFDERDFRLAVLGYVVMRIALVTQWLRVARDDAERRRTAHRYALGVTACQIVWGVVAVALPFELWLLAFAVLGPAELLVPVWAESASPTTWHAEHIAERYGLFMIIVLGESVLASSIAIQSATSDGVFTGKLLVVAAGGMLILFSIWWLYFDRPAEHLLTTTRAAFVWGYGHLLVFASVAAVGAGLSLAIEKASHPIALGPAETGAAVAIPVAVFLLSLWALHVRAMDPPIRKFGAPVTAVLVVAASFTVAPPLIIGLVLTLYVAAKVVARLRADSEILT
jgi:low temperature requirement protein LtrA